MAFDQHTNFAYSTVQAGSGVIGSTSGTTINIVNTGDLPDPGSGNYNVTVWPSGVNPTRANAEIMRVTAKSSTTITVTRAQEATTALSVIAAGYQVALAMTAKLLTDIEAVAGTGGGGGSAPPYARVEDQKASGTDGGNATTATWTKRALTTVVQDASSIVSLASSAITLGAGTYEIRARAPFFVTTRSKLRLRNTTDGTTTIVGSNTYSSASGAVSTDAHVSGHFTIAAAKTFELQYYVVTSGGGGNDLGVFTGSGELEVYAQLELWKIA